MNSTAPTRPYAAPAQPGWPTQADGSLIAPEPHFDGWDITPHGYFIVPVSQISLGDVVFGGTHQIEGMGRAEQRGTPALRLDLEYLAGRSAQSSARIVVPVDHTVEVKRYDALTHSRPHAWAWIHLQEDIADTVVAAGLIPDYHGATQRCCGPEENPDGYETAQTMCDNCVDSWSIDYDVVRHHRVQQ